VIVTGNDSGAVGREVAELLKAGWELAGGPQVIGWLTDGDTSNIEYCQALKKPVEKGFVGA
jgi:hypothetical protein